MNQIKKWVGIASSVVGGVVLVLSLTGANGSGCGGGSGLSGGDSCQAACDNVQAKCYASSSSYGASDTNACVDSCKARASSSSMTQSSAAEENFLVDCVAMAPTCDTIMRCTNFPGSF